jgi:hypothetical protein
VGVEKDTTMRDRGFKRPHIPRASDLILIQQEVVREFTSGDVDIDELAEAIRLLMERAPAARTDVGRRPDPDLLLPRRRATHVVGAETP